jgi:hypothetical protein
MRNAARMTLSMQECGRVTVFLAAGLAACAGPGTEQHLAPLYTHVSTPGGGEEYEAAGGSIIARRSKLGQPFDMWGVRPLFLHRPAHREQTGEVRSRTQFLYPFGRVVRGGGEFSWWLLPLFDYRQEQTPEGRKWTFFALPGIYLSRLPDGRNANVFWPLWGQAEELLFYDELDFVLWPLFMRTVKEGITEYHFPFPFLSFRSGPQAGGWRVWPVVGHKWLDEGYDRWFAAWPVFNYNKENLRASARYHQTQWTIFPLYGHASQGTYTSHSVLWPFFGYASDPSTGFWAWDGPWPLVRIRRPGDQKLSLAPDKQGNITRTRIWPFYSEYEGDGLHSYWYLWPLINERHEEYVGSEREAFQFVPFWTSWTKQTSDGHTHSWRKLWPLYSYERQDEVRRYRFPDLSFFWYWPTFDEHYSWMYELYTTEVGPDTVHERALAGLWRREHDGDEQRTYLSGLWSRRGYSEGGRAVSEHSLLFGLLRWRDHDADGLSLLRPAFPGPGWPIERVPTSLQPVTEGAASTEETP